MSWLRSFCIALQLLTRLPTPRCDYDAQSAGRSLLSYPLVGVLLGALIAATGWSLSSLFPPLPLAALLLVLWVLLTGALHLDGLADSADGWLGGHGDCEKTLRIMHDPQSGPAGIVAVVMVLLLKFAALGVLIERHDWLALASVPLLARTLALLLFLVTPCARPDGMAASLAAQLPRGGAWGMVLLGGAAAGYGAHAHPWLLPAAFVAFFLLRRLMMVRINGMTGDTTGALIESMEAVALLALIAAQARPAFW